MARGIADVLSLYLEATEQDRTSEARPVEITGERLAVPAKMGGLVEPFLVWNLNVALETLGRTAALQPDSAPRDGAALLLQHGSERGTRRAGRQLERWPTKLRVEVVVYGESAARESGRWVQRLAERAPLRHAPVIHRGGIGTGHAFARALLRREALARAAPGNALRAQFLAVAGRLLQSEAPPVGAAPIDE